MTSRFPVEGQSKDFDITDERRMACRTVVPGIVNSIAELIATYDPEYQEAIRSNVVLTGGESQMIGLPKLIEGAMEKLGAGRVTRVDEPLFTGSNGASKMVRRMPRHFLSDTGLKKDVHRP